MYVCIPINFTPLDHFLTSNILHMCVREQNKIIWYENYLFIFVTRWTKQAFSCSKFLSPGGQLWANTAFEGSQFYSIGVPKFYSWANVISVYVHNDLG